jgi:hypothetical protein
MSDITINDVIRKCNSFKPEELIIDDLKWKYLVRAVMRAKNIMIVGPSGCAKTMAARCVCKSLARPFFVFNCGGGQDARATLIGNTVLKKELGTLFHQSQFAQAIQTENAVILLDELTRGGHDFWNILFPVLDPTQRTLRLDEQEGSPTISVAKTVCFIATANIGNEYTATRVLDRALSRRFPIKLEMLPLNGEQLKTLFSILFPTRTQEQITAMGTLIAISEDLIAQCKMEDAKISTFISPANIVEMAELVMDGFTTEEIAEAAIYPEYPDDGGIGESERVYVKGVVQKHFPKNVKSPINDPLASRSRAKF